MGIILLKGNVLLYRLVATLHVVLPYYTTKRMNCGTFLSIPKP